MKQLIEKIDKEFDNKFAVIHSPWGDDFSWADNADSQATKIKNFIHQSVQEAVEAERERYRVWVEYEVIGMFGGSNPEERKKMRTRLDDYEAFSIMQERIKGE